MKRIALLTLIIGCTMLRALEPVPPPPGLPIEAGTYLLIDQGQLNDQLLGLAQSERIVIEVAANGALVIKEEGTAGSVIEVDGDTFTVIRKTKGRDGLWITTYVGSLSSKTPAVYYGNFVTICKTISSMGFGRGTFMLVRQDSSTDKK